MSSVLPLAPIRDLLARNCSFHISDDAVLLTRDLLENILLQVGVSAIEEFEELNNNRKKRGLRRLKRLNSWSVTKAAGKVLKDLTHHDMGSQPAMIGSPDGEKMLESKSVIKLDTDTWITGGNDDKH